MILDDAFDFDTGVMKFCFKSQSKLPRGRVFPNS